MAEILRGTITIVGAGPGDPDLLTVRALRALGRAEAVVYDRLVSEAILAHVPHGAARFFAGKSCKQKAMTQAEINALLVSLGRAGKNAVRLKGGDPFLFGRGGEEALALADAGVPYEIVPGVTSAQGCAAYAGIPLTHRGLATGVRYFTGHRMTADDTDAPLDLNWKSLADPDTTLVTYMGLANLEAIASELVAHGLPASTPAALIASGTTPGQRQLLTTLGNLPGKAREERMEPPALVIIGKVVSLANRLHWRDGQPQNEPLPRRTSVRQ